MHGVAVGRSRTCAKAMNEGQYVRETERTMKNGQEGETSVTMDTTGHNHKGIVSVCRTNP